MGNLAMFAKSCRVYIAFVPAQGFLNDSIMATSNVISWGIAMLFSDLKWETGKVSNLKRETGRIFLIMLCDILVPGPTKIDCLGNFSSLQVKHSLLRG